MQSAARCHDNNKCERTEFESVRQQVEGAARCVAESEAASRDWWVDSSRLYNEEECDLCSSRREYSCRAVLSRQSTRAIRDRCRPPLLADYKCQSCTREHLHLLTSSRHENTILKRIQTTSVNISIRISLRATVSEMYQFLWQQDNYALSQETRRSLAGPV